jgi:Cu(I)/Ag(I) efflux system protein CusF
MKTLLLALAMLAGAPAWAQTEWVRATVVRSEPARKLVTLDHEAIKSLPMEAMTMPFKVKDAALLAKVKAGDKVRFRVAMQDGEPVVTAIEAAP